jgi:hypothetical protein
MAQREWDFRSERFMNLNGFRNPFEKRGIASRPCCVAFENVDFMATDSEIPGQSKAPLHRDTTGWRKQVRNDQELATAQD